jgi:O-antigen/teichoic acid export membrane protein
MPRVRPVKPPPIFKSVLVFTLASLAVIVIAVGVFGVYGIAVAVIVGLAGFQIFARWYHRRYHSQRKTE